MLSSHSRRLPTLDFCTKRENCGGDGKAIPDDRKHLLPLEHEVKEHTHTQTKQKEWRAT